MLVSIVIAVMSHCTERGSELIVGDSQHIHRYEQSGHAHLAGVGAYSLPNQSDATIPIQSLRVNESLPYFHN